MAEKIVRIGAGNGFCHDSGFSVHQRYGCPGNISLNGVTRLRQLERIYSLLLPRDKVTITVTLDEQRIEMRETSEPAPHQSYTAPSPVPATAGEGDTVPLVKIAWGRSGDNGIFTTSASSHDIRSISLTFEAR